MTFRIRKSLLSSTDLFDIEVAAFAKEMRDWLEREAVVKREEGIHDIPPIERHHRYPAPSAHPIIVQAVDPETGMPDYEYVDDPIELVREQLIQRVTLDAGKAFDDIETPAKRRAAELRQADIAAEDDKRRAQVVEKHTGLLQKLKIKSLDPAAIEADIRAMRSDDDNAFLVDRDVKQKAIQDIHRKMVNAHSEIEDLNLETAKSYQLPKF